MKETEEIQPGRARVLIIMNYDIWCSNPKPQISCETSAYGETDAVKIIDIKILWWDSIPASTRGEKT